MCVCVCVHCLKVSATRIYSFCPCIIFNDRKLHLNKNSFGTCRGSLWFMINIQFTFFLPESLHKNCLLKYAKFMSEKLFKAS